MISCALQALPATGSYCSAPDDVQDTLATKSSQKLEIMIADKTQLEAGSEVSYTASSPTKLPVYAVSASETCSVSANGMIEIHSAGLCEMRFINFGDAVYRAVERTVFLEIPQSQDPTFINRVNKMIQSFVQLMSSLIDLIFEPKSP